MSCVPKAVPVTIMNLSVASRETVKSHSMPPRALSIWVYVTVPIGLSISFAQSRCRKSKAPEPCTSIFEKDVSSKSATVLRVVRVFEARAKDQLSSDQLGRFGNEAPFENGSFGVNRSGGSNPLFSRRIAPR